MPKPCLLLFFCAKPANSILVFLIFGARLLSFLFEDAGFHAAWESTSLPLFGALGHYENPKLGVI